MYITEPIILYISNDAGKDDDFFGDDGGDHNDQA